MIKTALTYYIFCDRCKRVYKYKYQTAFPSERTVTDRVLQDFSWITIKAEKEKEQHYCYDCWYLDDEGRVAIRD